MKYRVTPAEPPPPRTEERGSSVGVHPSDTETRSKPSATQDKQDGLLSY